MSYIHKDLWLRANTRLIPCAVLFVFGAILSSTHGYARRGSFEHRLIALAGVALFLVSATAFLHILTAAIHGSAILHRLGAGRAGAIQFVTRTFGYLAILLSGLELVGIPVGRILLGSAVLGIILGVAAQQALANVFASFVLILAHPFSVGEQVVLNSGALGGKLEGIVNDIGLTHTRLEEEDGNIIQLPNATLLSGASVIVRKKQPATKPEEK